MVKCIKDLNITADDTIVVVLPDSIRSYLSKFVDDDWLAANDLLPPTPPLTPPTEEGRPMSPTARAKDPFHGATIASLRLKPVTTISSDQSCADAIETMRDKGFDQLPVSSSHPPHKLIGLLTLGNLLSYISSSRASPNDPVEKVMFDFTKISEIKTDPQAAAFKNLSLSGSKKKRDFVEITKDTPLSALSRFFEWNSAAVVTERTKEGELKPVAVVTKIDLLTWTVRAKKNGAINGV
jgi:cystathionine beta-synthase